MELLEQFPEKLAGMTEKLRGQEERGILLPAEQLDICLHLIESLFQGEESLLKPWQRSGVELELSESEKARINAAVEAMNNSLACILHYLKEEYNKEGNPAIPGLCHIPGGIDYYRQQIITYTSYALDPAELHAIGLRELENTHGKMLAIIRQLGYEMDLKAFEQMLQKKRICFDDTPEQLQQRFDNVQAKIEPKAPGFLPACAQSRLPLPATPCCQGENHFLGILLCTHWRGKGRCLLV